MFHGNVWHRGRAGELNLVTSVTEVGLGNVTCYIWHIGRAEKCNMATSNTEVGLGNATWLQMKGRGMVSH